MNESRRVKFEPEPRKCGHLEVFWIESSYRFCISSECCRCNDTLPHEDYFSKGKRRDLG